MRVRELDREQLRPALTEHLENLLVQFGTEKSFCNFSWKTERLLDLQRKSFAQLTCRSRLQIEFPLACDQVFVVRDERQDGRQVE